jgi:hypothetical protein
MGRIHRSGLVLSCVLSLLSMQAVGRAAPLERPALLKRAFGFTQEKRDIREIAKKANAAPSAEGREQLLAFVKHAGPTMPGFLA